MDIEKTAWHPWAVRAARFTVAVVVLAGVYGTLRAAFDQLGQYEWSIRPGWLLLSGLLYLAGLLPCALFWHVVLRAFGQAPWLADTIRAHFIGQLGKYVPGKAMVIVMRTWFVHGPDVHATTAAVTVFVETLTMMAVGAFWAGAILLAWFPEQTAYIWLSIGLMLLSGIPTLPPVLRWIVQRVPQRLRGDQAVDLNALSLRVVARGWLLITCGWFVLGLSLWATLRGMGAASLPMPHSLPLLTATVSLAVVAGFLSGIPGGALVREGILWTLLANETSAVIAVAGAVMLRLVWLVSELVISTILYFGVRRRAAFGVFVVMKIAAIQTGGPDGIPFV